MNAKPMLTFTSGLVPRAVDRQRRRRRKPVKTPLIPRVKRVNLTERLSQENSGVSQWSGSVKWVSPQFDDPTTSVHVYNSRLSRALSCVSTKKGKSALETDVPEVILSSPPRALTKPAKVLTKRKDKAVDNCIHSFRFALNEIDSNSTDSFEDSPLANSDDLQLTSKTCDRGVTKPLASSQPHFDAASEDALALTSVLVCKDVASVSKGRAHDGIETDWDKKRESSAVTVSPGNLTTHKEMKQLQGRASPTPNHSDITDLSSMMECVSITTTHLRDIAVTPVSPHKLDPSTVLDITSFHPPVASTPLHQQPKLVDEHAKQNKCEEKIDCDSECRDSPQCVSPTWVCLKKPRSEVVERGRSNVVNSPSLCAANQQCLHVHDQIMGSNGFNIDHKALQAEVELSHSNDSTRLMTCIENYSPSDATHSLTRPHGPSSPHDCSHLSPAVVLAPETPIELWENGLRGRTRTVLNSLSSV